MCGLVAMISKQKFGFQYKDSSLFTQMLYADALRGLDSTGMFGVNQHNNVRMLKAAKPAAEFLGAKTVQDMIKDMFTKYKVMVGHNRASTKGATVDQNAHPFIVGDICLVHNGTLHTHKELGDQEVDSHAIAHAINKEGWEAVLPKINGAFALIWYNIKEKKLYIARNSQRPLWIIETKEADYIASEPMMLEWLVNRVHAKKETAKFFDTELVYVYDMSALDKGFDTVEMPKKVSPVVTKSANTTGKKMKRVKKNKQNILPFKPKVSISGTSQTGSSDSVAPDDLVKDDLVYFTYDKSIIQDNHIKIEGTQLFGEKARPVMAFLPVAKYSAAEIEEILECTEVFVGKYTGYSKLKSGGVALFCAEVRPEKMYTTILGQEVPESSIVEADGCCHDCGSILDEEDDNAFWVRENSDGTIKKILCSTCVATHPHLVDLIQTGDFPVCTNESSSSDTPSSQLPLNYSRMH